MSAEKVLPREQKASAIYCGCVHQHCCHTSQSVCNPHPPPPPPNFHKTPCCASIYVDRRIVALLW